MSSILIEEYWLYLGFGVLAFVAYNFITVMIVMAKENEDADGQKLEIE